MNTTSHLPRGLAAPVLAQRGVATLTVTMVILVLMTMLMAFSSRNLVVEIKSSANVYKSTVAQEAAEAGMEWALASINRSDRITSSCGVSTDPAQPTFRQRYLGTTPSGFAPTGAAAPGCRIGPTGSLSCSCPAAGIAAAGSCSSGSCPVFNVSFQAVAADSGAVDVVSRGCDSAGSCDAAASGDATVVITQRYKLIPALPTPPAAPLTARENVSFGSNAITVTNGDPSTNGITVNAGGSVTGFVSDDTLKTLPGTPAAASLVENDTSLSSLTEEQMFQTFFGQTKDSFRRAESTTHLTCSNPCNAQLQAEIAEGARVIWVDGDMVLSANATYGSADQPVILVVNGNVELRGGIVIYGVVYCEDALWDNTGGGDARVIGAMIAEGSFTATGTPNPTYDPDVLANLRRTTGLFSRVPGSWKDWQ